jgi:hypothetical protein
MTSLKRQNVIINRCPVSQIFGIIFFGSGSLQRISDLKGYQ